MEALTSHDPIIGLPMGMQSQSFADRANSNDRMDKDARVDGLIMEGPLGDQRPTGAGDVATALLALWVPKVPRGARLPVPR